MKREILNIDSNKWYHSKTLEKYYRGFEKRTGIQVDKQNTKFIIVKFVLNWTQCCFIEHPKTKRLRLATVEAYAEVGFQYD